MLLEVIDKVNEKGSEAYEALCFDKFSDINISLDDVFYYFSEDGVLSFDMIGEDGFTPIVILDTTENTMPYLLGKLSELERERAALDARLTEILTFNPKLLSDNVKATQLELDKVDNLIKNNELLAAMKQPIDDIRRHFASVSTVASSYEDIYKNIIKPVQEEGRAGVRETVKWAIISIVVSTVISLVLSNWDKLF
ncbi:MULTISPECIES: hypothetical protein [unclassified Psychrobacter]|uniref:hypothetical protein n=1 Tax=unclassified Psychrobacter TaxID=196806 RepID=UPI0018F55260|nr:MULTISPECIES: hypothetical protein [unclassified Psychrobacter]